MELRKLEELRMYEDIYSSNGSFVDKSIREGLLAESENYFVQKMMRSDAERGNIQFLQPSLEQRKLLVLIFPAQVLILRNKMPKVTTKMFDLLLWTLKS